MMSPSCTTYSLPSMWSKPASRTALFAAILDEVFVLDDLGADESFLEVRVNHTGALGRFPTALVSPRVHLDFARGDEGFQIKELVCGLNQAIDAALLKAYVLQELLSFLKRLEFCDVGLGCAATTRISAPSGATASRTRSTYSLPDTADPSSTLQT